MRQITASGVRPTNLLVIRTQRVDNFIVTNEFDHNVRSEVIKVLMGTHTYSYVFAPTGKCLAATNNAAGCTYRFSPLNQYMNILEGAAPSAPLCVLDDIMTFLPATYGRMAGGEGRHCQWDGYNIVCTTIQHSSFTSHKSFTWGLDLSGSLQGLPAATGTAQAGAGGVGGLLAEAKDGEPYFAAFDANGNMAEYLSTNSTLAAHCQKNPFIAPLPTLIGTPQPTQPSWKFCDWKGNWRAILDCLKAAVDTWFD